MAPVVYAFAYMHLFVYCSLAGGFQKSPGHCVARRGRRGRGRRGRCGRCGRLVIVIVFVVVSDGPWSLGYVA